MTQGARSNTQNRVIRNRVVRKPVRESTTAMATPPFHKLPVRRGPFNYLALLSCERESCRGREW
jgi:hypothetical protein